MLFGNRGPRSSAAVRREGFQPKLQTLEQRQLMAIDLGGVLPPAQPNIATAPFGVAMSGPVSPATLPTGSAGYSVSAVGDVNSDGFDDFVIGAPSGSISGGVFSPNPTGSSAAYLVFGSRQVTDATLATGTFDWLTLDNTGQRLGDLGQLGAFPQTNLISSAAGFPYAGITLTTGTASGTATQLGTSVVALGDLDNNGAADFMISAPGATDLNGLNPNTGRAYIVYGGTAMNSLQMLNLDTGGTGVTVRPLGSTLSTSRVGVSVARLGNFFASGSTTPDIAIGAPNASLAGGVGNGAVYVIPGSLITTPSATPINLTQIGNGLGGVTFAGSTSGEAIGQSVAGAGNVDGDLNTATNVGIDDLLIGAPFGNGFSGEAFLVYGGNAIPGAAAVVNGTSVILTSRIGAGASTSILGATFLGSGGAQSGFAVASVGDYNADGFSDIAIGSPFASSNTGQADIFYGQSTNSAVLIGTINIFSKPANVAATSLTLTGATTGALAGYSISASGRINTGGSGNDFIVGSPGLNGNQGGAYYFPANQFFVTGPQSLSTAESGPLFATLIQITNTPNGAPAFLGASVSGRFVSATQTNTADADLVADFIIGAPNWNAAANRTGAGGAYILEGARFPIKTPVNTAITTIIGVDSPLVGSGPFIVSATSPNQLLIYVTSNTAVTPAFNPFTDIDLSTIVVNGVLFPGATIAQTGDLDGDGTNDAVITISPRSNLNLTSLVTSLTITGRTTAANGNRAFFGTASITVSGGGGTPVTPGSVSGVLAPGTILPTTFTPQFGADHYVPPASALSRLNYKAIPRAVAYQQFLPGRGWAARLYNFAHPEKRFSRVPQGTTNSLRGKLPLTLGPNVFTRSKYHGNKTIEFHHENPVIPTYRQTERYVAKGRKHPKPR